MDLPIKNGDFPYQRVVRLTGSWGDIEIVSALVVDPWAAKGKGSKIHKNTMNFKWHLGFIIPLGSWTTLNLPTTGFEPCRSRNTLWGTIFLVVRPEEFSGHSSDKCVWITVNPYFVDWPPMMVKCPRQLLIIFFPRAILRINSGYLIWTSPSHDPSMSRSSILLGGLLIVFFQQLLNVSVLWMKWDKELKANYIKLLYNESHIQKYVYVYTHKVNAVPHIVNLNHHVWLRKSQ